MVSHRQRWVCFGVVRKLDMEPDSEYSIDRSFVQVGHIDDFNDTVEDIRFWLEKEPIERIRGLEFLRQSSYSNETVSERLPRFFEVVG